MRSLRWVAWSGRHPSARVDSLASSQQAGEKQQPPTPAPARSSGMGHGCAEWDGSTVASYHNHLSCSKSLREGFVSVEPGGLRDGA